MSKLALGGLAALALVSAACSRTGTGASVRTDITARMSSIQGPIQECYANTLLLNRKARGMMVVTFRAAPDSGQFDQVALGRDEPNDTTLRQCVLAEIAKLKLQTPQRSAVQISYPINFQPNK